MNVQKQKMMEVDLKREMKKKMIEDQVQETYYQSDEQYQKHLQEIKIKEEERMRKQKEWCELEYRRYNEQFLKSTNNYETYMQQKKETEKRTTKNLESLEKKLNEGYYRSIQKKEQVRLSAVGTLQKIEDVLQSQRRLDEEVQNERLMKYLERRKKYIGQLNKWEKDKNKSIQNLRLKHETKYSSAKANLSDVIDDRDRLFQSIIERQDEVQSRVIEVKQKREKEIQLR